MAAQTLDEEFQAPADAVCNAVQATAQQMAKQIDSADPAQRTIYFNTGLSWSSWTGQNVTATVTESGRACAGSWAPNGVGTAGSGAPRSCPARGTSAS